MAPASTPGPETLCVRVVKRESIRQSHCLTSQPCLSLSLDPFDPLPLGGGLVGLESCVASLSLNGLPAALPSGNALCLCRGGCCRRAPSLPGLVSFRPFNAPAARLGNVWPSLSSPASSR